MRGVWDDGWKELEMAWKSGNKSGSRAEGEENRVTGTRKKQGNIRIG